MNGSISKSKICFTLSSLSLSLSRTRRIVKKDDLTRQDDNEQILAGQRSHGDGYEYVITSADKPRIKLETHCSILISGSVKRPCQHPVEVIKSLTQKLCKQ